MSPKPHRVLSLIILSAVAFALLALAPPGGLRPAYRWIETVEAQGTPVVIENLTVPGSVYRVSVPRLEITGGTLSKDDIVRLLDASSPEPLSARAARLNFSSAVAPELILSSTIGTNQSRTVYKDVKFNNAVFGNIAEVTSSGATFEASGTVVLPTGNQETHLSGTFGAASIGSLDLVGMMKAFAEPADDGNLPYFTLYKSYKIDGFSLSGTLPNGTLSMSSGPLEGRDFKARPSRIGFAKALEILQAHPKLEEVDPAERKTVFGSLIDLLERVDFGVIAAKNLDVAMTIDEPQSASAPKKQIGLRYVLGALEMNLPERRFLIENIKVEVPKESFSFTLGRYALTGFSFGPTLSTLKTMIDEDRVSDEDFKAADPRDFVPILGTVLIGDMRVANLDPSQSFSIGEYRMSFGGQRRGIPTDIGFGLSHVMLDLSATKDAELAQLRDAGLRQIDASTSFAIKWREETKTIELSSLHADASGLGAFDLTGSIGNVQEQLFTSGLSTAQILALAMTAKEAKLEVRNDGMVDIISKIVAKEQKTGVPEFKTNFVEGVRIGLVEIFGHAPEVARVVDAVRALVIGGAKTMTIIAKAKTDLGLGFMDFVAAQKPEEVLKKVDVQADAH